MLAPRHQLLLAHRQLLPQVLRSATAKACTCRKCSSSARRAAVPGSSATGRPSGPGRGLSVRRRGRVEPEPGREQVVDGDHPAPDGVLHRVGQVADLAMARA